MRIVFKPEKVTVLGGFLSRMLIMLISTARVSHGAKMGNYVDAINKMLDKTNFKLVKSEEEVHIYQLQWLYGDEYHYYQVQFAIDLRINLNTYVLSASSITGVKSDAVEETLLLTFPALYSKLLSDVIELQMVAAPELGMRDILHYHLVEG